jgi:hypothetical protein
MGGWLTGGCRGSSTHEDPTRRSATARLTPPGEHCRQLPISLVSRRQCHVGDDDVHLGEAVNAVEDESIGVRSPKLAEPVNVGGQ